MSDWQTTRIAPDVCPRCGYRVDTASAPSGTPRPSDFSICLSCLSVNRFGDDLKLRRCPDSEWTAMPEADEIRRYRRAGLVLARLRVGGADA